MNGILRQAGYWYVLRYVINTHKMIARCQNVFMSGHQNY